MIVTGILSEANPWAHQQNVTVNSTFFLYHIIIISPIFNCMSSMRYNRYNRGYNANVTSNNQKAAISRFLRYFLRKMWYPLAENVRHWQSHHVVYYHSQFMFLIWISKLSRRTSRSLFCLWGLNAACWVLGRTIVKHSSGLHTLDVSMYLFLLSSVKVHVECHSATFVEH